MQQSDSDLQLDSSADSLGVTTKHSKQGSRNGCEFSGAAELPQPRKQSDDKLDSCKSSASLSPTDVFNHETMATADFGGPKSPVESPTADLRAQSPDVAAFMQPSCSQNIFLDSGSGRSVSVTTCPVQHSDHLRLAPGLNREAASGSGTSSSKSESAPLSDPIRRTSPCAFASTRHQSYGNLGISAGMAGLSSTSATLAFLPLRASSELCKQSVQATSLPVVSNILELTESSCTVSSSVCSYDTVSSSCQSSKQTSSAVSGTAAIIRDRRTNFFSEPPKPISLPTDPALVPYGLSASIDVASARPELDCTAGRSGITGAESSSSYVRPLAVIESRVLDDVNKLSISCDTTRPTLPVRSSYMQQPPPVTPAVQMVTVKPAALVVDTPSLFPAHADAGILLPRSNRSPEVESCRSPPAIFTRGNNGGGDSCSNLSSLWYRMSPRSRFITSPLSHTETAFWESAGGAQTSISAEGSSPGMQQPELLYEAYIPSSSSAVITPPKAGNIQKLKAFFGETTPRIIEAKTDARTSNDTNQVPPLAESSVEADSSADVKISREQRISTTETVVVGKPYVATSTQLDKMAMTAKGKKMASWVLSSRHHSSHPQLPSTRPKKTMGEREPSLSPKQKEHRTWKGKVVRTFKRHSSSSAVVTSDPPSQPEEITGTFGVPLECCYPSVMNELVPLVVEVCTQVVEERGLENLGIYRVPGNSVAINTLVEELNRDPDSACLDNEKWQDVNSVSSLLKLFFRKLPDSLITDDLYEDVITANRTENSERRMLKLKKLLHELPDHNFETFRFLAQHLNKVTTREEANKMDAHNLAIVFGPTLVRPQDNSMVVMVKDMTDQCRVVESIIVHCDWFFSSWDEDVNVPVDEQSGDVPISTMNQQLLAKAESLAAVPFYRDLISFVRAKPNKKKPSLDKSKSADHDPDLSSRRSTSCSNTSSYQTAQSVPGRTVSSENVLAAAASYEIRRYPAYRFNDAAGTGFNLKTTENAKPCVMRQASQSCESLKMYRGGGGGDDCKQLATVRGQLHRRPATTARISNTTLPV